MKIRKTKEDKGQLPHRGMSQPWYRPLSPFISLYLPLSPKILILNSSFLILLAGCDGLFDGIYDDPPVATEEYGFRADGTIYLDCRSYTHWTYVDLHHRHIDTAAVGAAPPAEWDFALHHYDVRTNGGTACATPYADPDLAAEAWLDGQGAGWVFDADVADSIAVDLSGMVTGNIIYVPSELNPALCGWMDLDLSHMPPDYSTSDLAYMLRMADGTVAVLRMADYRNAAGEKGYITIAYRLLN